MVDVKEIRSLKLAPFTLMSSSIQAILAFIYAIVLLIIFGITAAVVPQFSVFGAVITGIGVALIIIYPISAFFIGLAVNFFSILLYNALVPRLGGIKLGLEGNELTEIPVISFALILASIEAIWAFIIGLFLAALLIPFTALLSSSTPIISQAIANATNVTHTTIPTGAALGASGAFLAALLIIALPIAVFIIGFISHALIAIFYNYIATRASKIQLNFTAMTGTWFDLTSIPVLPTAIAIAITMTIFLFIFSVIPQSITTAYVFGAVAGIIRLITTTIVYFIEYFIIAALVAIFYNYLAPRIGAVKLELE